MLLSVFLYTSVLNRLVISTINLNYTLLYIKVITSLMNLHDSINSVIHNL